MEPSRKITSLQRYVFFPVLRYKNDLEKVGEHACMVDGWWLAPRFLFDITLSNNASMEFNMCNSCFQEPLTRNEKTFDNKYFLHFVNILLFRVVVLFCWFWRECFWANDISWANLQRIPSHCLSSGHGSHPWFRKNVNSINWNVLFKNWLYLFGGNLNAKSFIQHSCVGIGKHL